MVKRSVSKPTKKTDRVDRGDRHDAENSMIDAAVAEGADIHGPCPDGYTAKRWAAKSRELLSEYGISGGVYRELWLRQHGKCGVCGKQSGEKVGCFYNAEMVVDHCHMAAGTNDDGTLRGRSPMRPLAIRGLLCGPCNTKLTEEVALKLGYYAGKGKSVPNPPFANRWVRIWAPAEGIEKFREDVKTGRARRDAEWLLKVCDYLEPFYAHGSPLLQIWPDIGSMRQAAAIAEKEAEAEDAEAK